MSTTVIQPKYVGQHIDIAKATLSAAKVFNLGGKPIQLGLDTRPKQQMALAGKFELKSSAQRKLGRQENAMECISSAIVSRTSRAELNSYLVGLRVPEYLREHAQFYFVSARRREVDVPRLATVLTKKHKIVSEEHLILGLVQEEKKLRLMIVPSGRRGITLVEGGPLLQALQAEAVEDEGEDDNGNDEHNESKSETTVVSYPDDHRQDFAVCYKDCFNEIPDWLLATVSGICGGCITLIGLTATPATPVATPLLVGVCGGCVAAIGIVIGNCIITCHEMFGQ